MEVKINLSDNHCREILCRHDYVSKEVKAYYQDVTIPYEDKECAELLKSVKIKIAYPKKAKPKELDERYPMVRNLEKFSYEKVVSALFNMDLWHALVKHY